MPATMTGRAEKSPVKTEPFRTRDGWKALGYRVPTRAKPAKVEEYLVPGYRNVYRMRHVFSSDQVNAITPDEAARRTTAAQKAVISRIAKMEERMRTCPLTIKRGKSIGVITQLALSTHGGNYAGDPGEFIWCNRKARNAIRHCLTNYEQWWARINRGVTAANAYTILRDRVAALVDEADPQFAEGMPELPWPDGIIPAIFFCDKSGRAGRHGYSSL